MRRVATVGIVRSRNAKKPAAVADQRPVQGEDGIPLARVSRSPRILPFVLTGLVLGVVVGLVIAIAGGEGGNYTEGSTLGYFALLFGGIGALLGGVGFALADKRAQR